MNDATPPRPGDIGIVEDRFFTLRDFPLTNGAVMPEATIAYETYGRLAPHGRNAVLVTHGFTGSHHAAGRNPANGDQPGSWDGLIGPGKAIDTDRLFVVASNMLGSSYGSTNAASINPETGKPYGPDFPAIAISDIVRAQKNLLQSLGVEHLVAVAGPSYGGYQSFQWAVAYPDFMDAIVPVNTAPWASVNTDKQLAEVTARLEADPDWQGGRYHGTGRAPVATLTQIRIDTLTRYGTAANLARRYPDPKEAEAALREMAENWARNWDAHSLHYPAPRPARLGHKTRFRPDQGQGALHPVPQRRAVPAEDCARRDRRAEGGRGRGALFRDRQRSRPLVERPRARQVVAGAARIPRTADRPRELTERPTSPFAAERGGRAYGLHPLVLDDAAGARLP